MSSFDFVVLNFVCILSQLSLCVCVCVCVKKPDDRSTSLIQNVSSPLLYIDYDGDGFGGGESENDENDERYHARQ